MGQVSVTVNRHSFTIACDDGQEPRVRRLAQYIEAKIAEFVGTLGQVGDTRLLLLAALVITDELSDANEALQQQARARPADAGAADDAGASGIHRIAQRVEAIAARLESG